jgi:zinc transporter ZupT
MPPQQTPQPPHDVPQDAEIQELKKITEELKAVKVNTGSSWGAFLRGMLSGGGAIIGGVIAVVLIGIVLSVMGIIPGFKTIADYINAAMANVKHY